MIKHTAERRTPDSTPCNNHWSNTLQLLPLSQPLPCPSAPLPPNDSMCTLFDVQKMHVWNEQRTGEKLKEHAPKDTDEGMKK